MTTQSTVQYFIVCHPHGAPMGSTLFYKGPFGVQHLFWHADGKTGMEPPTFWLEDDRSTAQPQPYKCTLIWLNALTKLNCYV